MRHLSPYDPTFEYALGGNQEQLCAWQHRSRKVQERLRQCKIYHRASQSQSKRLRSRTLIRAQNVQQQHSRIFGCNLRHHPGSRGCRGTEPRTRARSSEPPHFRGAFGAPHHARGAPHLPAPNLSSAPRAIEVASPLLRSVDNDCSRLLRARDGILRGIAVPLCRSPHWRSAKLTLR